MTCRGRLELREQAVDNTLVRVPRPAGFGRRDDRALGDSPLLQQDVFELVVARTQEAGPHSGTADLRVLTQLRRAHPQFRRYMQPGGGRAHDLHRTAVAVCAQQTAASLAGPMAEVRWEESGYKANFDALCEPMRKAWLNKLEASVRMQDAPALEGAAGAEPELKEAASRALAAGPLA